MIVGKKTLLNMKRVFLFSKQILCGTFPIPRVIGRDIIKNVCWSSRMIYDMIFYLTFHKSTNKRIISIL